MHFIYYVPCQELVSNINDVYVHWILVQNVFHAVNQSLSKEAH